MYVCIYVHICVCMYLQVQFILRQRRETHTHMCIEDAADATISIASMSARWQRCQLSLEQNKSKLGKKKEGQGRSLSHLRFIICK